MGSYELIKGKDDQGTWVIKNRNNYSLQIDGYDQDSHDIDVESATRKFNSSQSGGNGKNISSLLNASGGGGGGGDARVLSLDVYRGLTVAVCSIFPYPLYPPLYPSIKNNILD